MNIYQSEILISFYENVDIFMAVFARTMGFLFVLPVMSGQNIPIIARVSLSLGISLLAFTSNSIILPEYSQTIMGFGFLILQEIALGLILGFIVLMFFSIFHFIGQLVDFQMGFSMVSVNDPFTMVQTPITGNFYHMLISVFFILTGALHMIIRVFFESFSIINLGQAQILENASIPYGIMLIIIQYFSFGLQISLPVVGTLILVDLVLGILVKAVPQMNVFVVGIPLKVFIGLIIIFLTLPVFQDAFAFIMDDVIFNILNLLGSMVFDGG